MTSVGAQEVEVTQRILADYASLPPEELKRGASQPPGDLHPQAAEMFIWMAEHAVDQIGNGGESYLDCTVPVTGLALTGCLVACEKSQRPPDFARPRRPDPWVHAEFNRQLVEELNREQAARLRNGIWRCWFDPTEDVAHHRLTRRRRVSALMLLNSGAQAACLQQLMGKSFADCSSDELYHAIASSPEMLYFITHADPAGWAQFEAAMGANSERLAAVASLAVFLKFAGDVAGHSYWHDEESLTNLWEIFTTAHPRYAFIPAQDLVATVLAFSMRPSEAAASLMNPPFYLLHNKLLRNPCFLKAHSSISSLLTIGIRRHERAWDRTLGSSLARAADTLATMLPQADRLKIVVRRKYKGGDVDLAMYDEISRELLLCEVKTVYDKHRADSLMHRFEDAKVNVERACSQLELTERAILTGQLTMGSLFGGKRSMPTQVHKALLTWLDPIDLTMGTEHENVLSLNFALFLCLANASGGDVRAMARAVRELRNIWPVAQIRPLNLGQPTLRADVEIQTDMLDTRKSLTAVGLSPMVVQIIEAMKSVDEDVDLKANGPFVSYLADTASVLAAG